MDGKRQSSVKNNKKKGFFFGSAAAGITKGKEKSKRMPCVLWSLLLVSVSSRGVRLSPRERWTLHDVRHWHKTNVVVGTGYTLRYTQWEREEKTSLKCLKKMHTGNNRREKTWDIPSSREGAKSYWKTNGAHTNKEEEEEFASSPE